MERFLAIHFRQGINLSLVSEADLSSLGQSLDDQISPMNGFSDWLFTEKGVLVGFRHVINSERLSELVGGHLKGGIFESSQCKATLIQDRLVIRWNTGGKIDEDKSDFQDFGDNRVFQPSGEDGTGEQGFVLTAPLHHLKPTEIQDLMSALDKHSL